MRNKKHELMYHIMLMPSMIFVVVFSIIPMFGIIIAFMNYQPAFGLLRSEWVGLANFRFIFQLSEIRNVLRNTVIIAVSKIILGFITPFVFSLLLNEVRVSWFKRSVQTIVYLPNFLSWVIFANIVYNLFSLSGIVNQVVAAFGNERILFFASNYWFRPIIILTDVWKGFGFGTIIYLAAISNVNPVLYESAVIDGAKRFQLVKYITIPSIAPTAVLVMTLSLGSVLNAGFDQIFNLYNPLVYRTGDILDTYIFRQAFNNAQFSLSTAVGLLKSLVSMVLIITSYKLAGKFANYRIF